MPFPLDIVDIGCGQPSAPCARRSIPGACRGPPTVSDRPSSVGEQGFACRGGTQLGRLSVGVVLTLGVSGVADFVCYAENGTAGVSARFGFGTGFRQINYRRVANLVVDVDEPAGNDQFRAIAETYKTEMCSTDCATERPRRSAS